MESRSARILSVTWVAKAGDEDRIASILKLLAISSRDEPGCVQFVVHRGPSDPRLFFLYEVYRDASALNEHSESEHFKRYVLGQALPLLESRQRVEWSFLDA